MAKTICHPYVFAILASPNGVHFGIQLLGRPQFFLARRIKMPMTKKSISRFRNKYPTSILEISGRLGETSRRGVGGTYFQLL